MSTSVVSVWPWYLATGTVKTSKSYFLFCSCSRWIPRMPNGLQKSTEPLPAIGFCVLCQWPLMRVQIFKFIHLSEMCWRRSTGKRKVLLQQRGTQTRLSHPALHLRVAVREAPHGDQEAQRCDGRLLFRRAASGKQREGTCCVCVCLCARSSAVYWLYLVMESCTQEQ